MPVIVKPNFEGASKGITSASIATSPIELERIVRTLLRDYPDGVLVEELVEGIDVSVAWIEGIGLLPSIAYRYDAPTDAAAIYDFELKHVRPACVRPEIPARLDELTARRLAVEAERVFSTLGVRGLGRADFRVTPTGDIIFLEMNPLPSLGDGEIFVAAAQLGMSAREVLRSIVKAAIPRRSFRTAYR